MNYFHEGKQKLMPRHNMMMPSKNKEKNFKTAIEFVVLVMGKQKYNIRTPKLPMSKGMN